jgi:hypothetical protein
MAHILRSLRLTNGVEKAAAAATALPSDVHYSFDHFFFCVSNALAHSHASLYHSVSPLCF